MTTSARRWILLLLALTAAYTGSWATLAPQAWFDAFPGFGHHWLPILGPYDEHLARDTGGLFLALCALSIGAAFRAADGFLVRLAGVCWLVFSIPHTIYHFRHLDMYDTTDAVLNVVGLAAILVLAAVLLLPARAKPTTA